MSDSQSPHFERGDRASLRGTPVHIIDSTHVNVVVESDDGDRIRVAHGELQTADAAGDLQGDPDDLTRIEGIGPARESDLNDAGIVTIADLAVAAPETVTNAGIADSVSHRLIANARSLNAQAADDDAAPDSTDDSTDESSVEPDEQTEADTDSDTDSTDDSTDDSEAESDEQTDDVDEDEREGDEADDTTEDEADTP